jgi:hypothetical protein
MCSNAVLNDLLAQGDHTAGSCNAAAAVLNLSAAMRQQQCSTYPHKQGEGWGGVVHA